MASTEDLLAQEYLHLQKVIEDFDTKTLTVKAWSVTFSATAIGFAFDKTEPAILVVAAISAMAFWLVEALIKVNQQAYYGRIEEIEAHFSDGQRRQPLQIGRAWAASFAATGGYRRVIPIMAWPHVALPHAAVIAAALLLLAVYRPEPLPARAPAIPKAQTP